MILVRKEVNQTYSSDGELTEQHNDLALEAPDTRIASMYDRYFSSGFYDDRYSGPNHFLFNIIARDIDQGQAVLDFGCGNGRYLIPLAVQRKAHFYGYDISASAIEQLNQRLLNIQTQCDVSLFHNDMVRLEEEARRIGGFDHILMLFGVLAHIEGVDNRIELLKKLRACLKPNGRIILGVPNIRRRLRKEYKDSEGEAQEEGDVYYKRIKNGISVELFYHLFCRKSIHDELQQAGFNPYSITPESILPERMMTKKSGAFFDRLLRPVIPTDWAYGFLVEASQ